MLNSQIELWPKNVLILPSLGQKIPQKFVINTALRNRIYFVADKSSSAMPILCDAHVFARLIWFIKR